MSYGMSPHREVIKYNVRRVNAWDEQFTLFIKDIREQEHKINTLTVSKLTPEHSRKESIRAHILRWLDDIVFSSKIADYIIKEPLERKLIPEMFISQEQKS